MTPKPTSPGQINDQTNKDQSNTVQTSPTQTAQTNSTNADAAPVRYDVSLLTPEDFYLFNEGSHYRIYDKLGAHPHDAGGTAGTGLRRLGAECASRLGHRRLQRLESRPRITAARAARPASGRASSLASPRRGSTSFTSLRTQNGYERDKSRSLRLLHEMPPRTASVVWDLDYDWNDAAWMAQAQAPKIARRADLDLRGASRLLDARPRRGQPLADLPRARARLADYVKKLGFTHVEFMPIMEHPFYGSWGYQTTGYFAPTTRYGTPQDLMYLIDYLHQHGIGVILDWVPAHFPTDGHGLAYFDGTHLYEHADPRQGFHPDWEHAHLQLRPQRGAQLPDLERAVLARQIPHRRPARRCRRLDALSRLLAQDGRMDSQPLRRPREPRSHRLPAALQRTRSTANYPDVQTIAEESTAWPMVSRPTYLGGLGFGLKWDMGWMHDTLRLPRPATRSTASTITTS